MTLDYLGPYPDAAGYEHACALDDADPLRDQRQRYVHADPELIYLDGNSLGMLSHDAAKIVNEVTHRQWGERMIRSWNEGWWELHLRLGDLLAPILGAGVGEVMVSDSTSVNLYKLAMAAVDYKEGRTRIITDDLNFPSDVYVLRSVAETSGGTLEVVPSDGIHGPVERLVEAIDDSTALVALSHTVFKSGYTYDMESLGEVARAAGAMILWDCSHSVGTVPIDFGAAQVDLAVGCTYKYLNGGPGSPAFLYVRRDLQDSLHNPIAAWWGHADPFSFQLDFEPVSGIRRFHTGTMPILSLAAVEAGIRHVVEVGVEVIRAKSVLMGEYLIDQWETHLAPLGFGLASPSDSHHRGSHVTLSHPEAWPIARAMIERAKVIPDFRTPDSIRLGLSALYNGFVDLHTAVQRVARIVGAGGHEAFANDRPTVT